MTLLVFDATENVRRPIVDLLARDRSLFADILPKAESKSRQMKVTFARKCRLLPKMILKKFVVGHFFARHRFQIFFQVFKVEQIANVCKRVVNVCAARRRSFHLLVVCCPLAYSRIFASRLCVAIFFVVVVNDVAHRSRIVVVMYVRKMRAV